MRLDIPYGRGSVTVELDDANVAGVVLATHAERGDEREILAAALSRPVGSAPLNAFLAGSTDTVVIVNDAKRPTPTAKVLDLIRPELEEVGELTFVIATGTHRPPTPEETAAILGGAERIPRASVVVHDATSAEDMTYLGRTARGTEVRLNRLVVDAARIVTIGSVEPHYFAGFTGGRKTFLPGVAAFETVRQNHSHSLEPSSCFMALEAGGILILVAECREGPGNDAFVEQLRSADSPEDVAQLVGEHYSLGDHKAVKLAELVMGAEIWAVTELPDETLESIFFRPFARVQDALDVALKKKGPDARVLFLMDACTTVPRLP